MVSGINVGIQYIFWCDRDIDYFNDFLQVSIDIRKKLVERDSNSFIIFTRKDLNQRFQNLEIAKIYCNAHYEIYYDGANITREKNPDYLLYYDVMMYNNEKHKSFQKMSNEDFIQLQNEYKADSTKNDRSRELSHIINIQTILRNEEYFQKIQKIENEFMQFMQNELTMEEMEIIHKIENHYLFHFDVKWSGFELVIEKY